MRLRADVPVVEILTISLTALGLHIYKVSKTDCSWLQRSGQFVTLCATVNHRSNNGMRHQSSPNLWRLLTPPYTRARIPWSIVRNGMGQLLCALIWVNHLYVVIS